MARKNRLSVPDGIYHISSRIANRQFLLKDAAVKEKIIGWMYDVADFSGGDDRLVRRTAGPLSVPTFLTNGTSART